MAEEENENIFHGFLAKYYPHLNYAMVDNGYYLFPDQVKEGYKHDYNRLFVNDKKVLAGEGGWYPMDPEHEKQFNAIIDDWNEMVREGYDPRKEKAFLEKWLPQEKEKEKEIKKGEYYDPEREEYERNCEALEKGEEVDKKLNEFPQDVWINYPNYINLYIHTFENMKGQPKKIAFALKGGACSTIEMFDGSDMGYLWHDLHECFDFRKEISIEKLGSRAEHEKTAVTFVEKAVEFFDKRDRIDNPFEIFSFMEKMRLDLYKGHHDSEEDMFKNARRLGKFELREQKWGDRINEMSCVGKKNVLIGREGDYMPGLIKVGYLGEKKGDDFYKLIGVKDDYKMGYFLYKEKDGAGNCEVFEFKNDFNRASARNFLNQYAKNLNEMRKNWEKGRCM